MSKQAGRMSQGANDFLTPYAPTIGTATDVGTSRAYDNGAVTVTFTHTGPNAATSYTASGYCSVHGTTHSVSGASSPLTITGFGTGAITNITVTGTNAAGTGPASAASNSVTVTTVPQSPTIGAATDTPSGRPYNNGAASVAFTARGTGGKAITGYTVLSSGSQTGTGASSPITVAGLASATAYTFTVKATNANGDSAYSSASNTITATTVPDQVGTPSATTPSAGVDRLTWTAPANGGSAITVYNWSASDGKSGSTGGTSVDIGQEQGSAQTYTVTAVNANGSASTSPASGSVTTTFSFVPFSVFGFSPFSVFGFSPFGFSPFGVFGFSPFGVFGFSPFGFSPFGVFGFSPFGFSPFGFSPFGFSPFSAYSRD